MNIYMVRWNGEPEKLYMAESMAEAIDCDYMDSVKDIPDREEHEAGLESVTLLGELANPPETSGISGENEHE